MGVRRISDSSVIRSASSLPRGSSVATSSVFPPDWILDVFCPDGVRFVFTHSSVREVDDRVSFADVQQRIHLGLWRIPVEDLAQRVLPEGDYGNNGM